MARVIRRAIAGCLIAIIVLSLLKAFVTKPSDGSSKLVESLPARPDAYFLEMHSSNGRRSKEFVSGQRKRLESNDANGEQPQVLIYRRDKAVTWNVEPGSKTVLELPYTPEVEATYEKIAAIICWSEEGTGVIEGCKCTRFVGRYGPRGASMGYSFMGPGGAHEELFIDASNGLPVRQITYDRRGKAAAINERVAFNLDPPDPELFELPKGYDVEHVPLNP
jgi:hypothetical protein